MADFTPYLKAFTLECFKQVAKTPNDEVVVKAVQTYLDTGKKMRLPSKIRSVKRQVFDNLDVPPIRQAGYTSDNLLTSKKDKAWGEARLLHYAKKAGLIG